MLLPGIHWQVAHPPACRIDRRNRFACPRHVQYLLFSCYLCKFILRFDRSSQFLFCGAEFHGDEPASYLSSRQALPAIEYQVGSACH